MAGQHRASDIAGFLGLELKGPNSMLTGVSSLSRPRPGTLTFISDSATQAPDELEPIADICVISSHPSLRSGQTARIVSDNPRQDFALAFTRFFSPEPPKGIAETARIASSAELGENTSVGHHSVIGNNVTIGANCEIHHNVVIAPNCTLGSRVRVKSGTVIGEKGFGFAIGPNGVPIEIPHIGGVAIGDSVEIGALNTIVGGTIDPTVIEDHVKTDDHVHIAHNVHIGRGTMITAAAELSGSVVIGAGSWIGPQASIRDGLTIAENVLVGIGSVVTRSIEADVVVAGNPARVLRKR